MANGTYTLVATGIVNGDRQYKEFVGKSTYVKPVGKDILQGSQLFDMDTKTAYMYDSDTESWIDITNDSDDTEQSDDESGDET